MSDDIIYREDAIEAITNHCENECYYRVDNWCPQCQREEFEEAIKALPSADRPQGEWIDEGRNLWGCSNCGMEIYSESERDRNEFHKWCSRCGSRMKRADDE